MGKGQALLGEIKQRIRVAQYEALKAVNKELIALKKNSHQWCEKLAGPKISSFGVASYRILNTLPQELRGNPPFEG